MHPHRLAVQAHILGLAVGQDRRGKAGVDKGEVDKSEVGKGLRSEHRRSRPGRPEGEQTPEAASEGNLTRGKRPRSAARRPHSAAPVSGAAAGISGLCRLCSARIGGGWAVRRGGPPTPGHHCPAAFRPPLSDSLAPFHRTISYLITTLPPPPNRNCRQSDNRIIRQPLPPHSPGRPGIQAELSAPNRPKSSPNRPKSGTGPQTALTSLCLGYRLSDNCSPTRPQPVR